MMSQDDNGATTSPLRMKLGTVDSEELNLFSKLNHWQTDYQQLAGGAFESRFDLYRSEQLCVSDQYCSQEMLVAGVPPPEEVALFMVLNRGNRGIFNGRPLAENEVFVMCPGSEGTFRTPPKLRMINLQIPKARLRAALSSMACAEIDQFIPGTHRMTLPQNTISRLSRIAAGVLGLHSDSCSAERSEITRHEEEEHLITTLVSGLTAGCNSGPKLGLKQRRDCVAKARDYIKAHLTSPLGPETLAREVGVSQRTLEYAFRDVFDITPLRYIKTRRLHATHRLLLEAAPGSFMICDGALKFGFTHPSYFARDYRRLFGELPSETLSRKKS